MRETPSEDVPEEEDAVSEIGMVTYTIKVLSTGRDARGEPVRTVLFQRTSPGEHLEICAEIDASNLLAGLPDLLEAAFDLQRRELSRLHVSHLEEACRVRRLTLGEGRDAPRRAGPVRLVGWRGLPVDAPGPVM